MERILFVVAPFVALLGGCPIDVGLQPDFRATLTGDQEVPPVMTQVSGDARLFVHSNSQAIDFELEITQGEDALGAAGAHLHCAEAGENGPVVVFLAGEVPGGFDGRLAMAATIDEANIVDDSCGSTIPELVDAMFDGRVYVNVHNVEHPGGVVRGQLEPPDGSLL